MVTISPDLLRKRLAFIRQGSETVRFHTKRTLQQNDVGHHSFHVAWLVDLMARASGFNEAERYRMVMAALAHDLAEHITGDMPGDAKRDMDLRQVYSKYEQRRFQEVGLLFEDGLDEYQLRIIKLADMMEGAFFCISEASLGNDRFGIVFKNFRSYINAHAPFSDCEEQIILYIDELWKRYGKDLSAPGWGKTAHEYHPAGGIRNAD